MSRLSVEGAEFWLADESPEHGNFSPESLGGGSARMILTVPDPDAMFRGYLFERFYLTALAIIYWDLESEVAHLVFK